MEHYRARRFREAIFEFELSLGKLRTAEVQWNLARAHEQLGQDARAAERYRFYLRDRVDAPDNAEVLAKIALLEERIKAANLSARSSTQGMLAIDASQNGVLVLLDGRRLGVGPIDSVLPIAAGRHRLTASLAGHLPALAEVEVLPGALSAAYLELAPVTRHAESTASETATWIAAGASVTLLLASGPLGLLALSERSDGDLAAARRAALSADLALGGALCAAIVASVHYLSRVHAERE